MTYSAHTAPDLQETWHQSISDLETELRQCHRQLDTLTGRIARLEKQRSVLDNFADGMNKKTAEEVMSAALPPTPLLPLASATQHDKKHSKKQAASAAAAAAAERDIFSAGLLKRAGSEVRFNSCF